MHKVLEQLASRRFARGVAAALLLRAIVMRVKLSDKAPWVAWPVEGGDLPLGVRGIAWAGVDGPRTMLLGCRVEPAKRRFDVVVKRFGPNRPTVAESESGLRQFLGLGEIEGLPGNGNWKKNGQVAMAQAKSVFENHETPMAFYLGTNIIEETAAELWKDLEGGLLQNAANAQNDHQLAALCLWVIGL